VAGALEKYKNKRLNRNSTLLKYKSKSNEMNDRESLEPFLTGQNSK